MITQTQGEAIATEAMRLVGAPFRHQGRLPEFGLDCAGVVLWCCKIAGCEFTWPATYRIDPSPIELLEALGRHFSRVEGEPEPGDVVAFQFPADKGPKHVGIYVGDGSMIHVFGRSSRVRLDLLAAWADRMHSVWRRKP